MNKALKKWVKEVAHLTTPDRIVWCDGSKAENDRLVAEQVEDGSLTPLDSETYPNCYLARSDPQDVARVEHRTFICCDHEDDAGLKLAARWKTPGLSALT